MTMTYQDAWKAAMAAARRRRVYAVDERTYAVRSESRAATEMHLVTLAPNGKIADCSNCQGWRGWMAGRGRPCWHAGAVANHILRERRMAYRAAQAATLIDLTMGTVEPPPTTRDQIYQEESA